MNPYFVIESAGSRGSYLVGVGRDRWLEYTEEVDMARQWRNEDEARGVFKFLRTFYPGIKLMLVTPATFTEVSA